jgi:hypothetical protein
VGLDGMGVVVGSGSSVLPGLSAKLGFLAHKLLGGLSKHGDGG